MNEKYVLIAFLATLTAIVTIVVAGIVAVALELKNPEAFQVLAAAVSTLALVASQFRPGKGNQE